MLEHQAVPQGAYATWSFLRRSHFYPLVKWKKLCRMRKLFPVLLNLGFASNSFPPFRCHSPFLGQIPQTNSCLCSGSAAEQSSSSLRENKSLFIAVSLHFILACQCLTDSPSFMPFLFSSLTEPSLALYIVQAQGFHYFSEVLFILLWVFFELCFPYR